MCIRDRHTCGQAARKDKVTKLQADTGMDADIAIALAELENKINEAEDLMEYPLPICLEGDDTAKYNSKYHTYRERMSGLD